MSNERYFQISFSQSGDPGDSAHKDTTYMFDLKDADDAFVRYDAPPWWKLLKNKDSYFRNFESWIISHKETSKTATHVALNKGNFCIPFEEEEEFLKNYSVLLLENIRMWFVERPTPIIRLFVDLDFKQTKRITGYGIEAACFVCNQTVQKFFPGMKSILIVCCTRYKQEKEIEIDGKSVKRWKTGVHLHWKDFYVTGRQALDIRESIISALTDAFGLRSSPMNDWSDVVDSSVYGDGEKNGSGLRMLGSNKTENCTDCKRKGVKFDAVKSREVPCEMCSGNGIVDSGRPYHPLFVMDAEGKRLPAEEKAYKEDLLSIIKHTKLRTALNPEESYGFKLPPGAAIYLGKERKRKHAQCEKQYINPTDPLYLALQDAIRTSFGQTYNDIVVQKVSRFSKGVYVTIIGKNSRFCKNIGREHSSNRIYFQVTREGLCQRCYDNAKDLTSEMNFGLCKDYASACMPLSSSLHAMLWDTDTMSLFTKPELTPGNCPLSDFLDTLEMQRLLKYGDFLSRQLFNTKWTDFLGFNTISVSNLPKYVPIDERDLGSKGHEAYLELGMPWASELMENSKAQETMDPFCAHRSMEGLYTAVLDKFEYVVNNASLHAKPELFSECGTLDEILHVLQTSIDRHEVEEIDLA